jgi:AcrR family transcriptional regulator
MNDSFIHQEVSVPRTEEENQRVRDEQRARILEGARAAFARTGMATTMADVAAAAGVSQGLAYRYFTSKDDLVRALVAESVGAQDLRVEDQATPGATLERLLTVILEARREHPELFQVLYHVLEDRATPPDLLDQVRQRGMRFAELLRRLIVAGQASGEVAGDDPDQLSAAILAMLDGLGRFTLSHPDVRGRFPEPHIVLRMLRP